MMKQRKDLYQSQIFDSFYAPVQVYDKSDNKHGKFIQIEELKNSSNLDISKEQRILNLLKWAWKQMFGYFGEEWFFLSILGIVVALISYAIDKGNLLCNNVRLHLYSSVALTPLAKYFAWVTLPVLLVLFSVAFVRFFAPKAAGSGLPEIKTILRGVYIDDFLTMRVLIAKMLGLTAVLGAAMPLGKEGPLIHIASCCAHLLGKLTTFQGIYQNKTRRLEMIGAASAVGVACTFGAPVGGVLLSVEITTAYFAIRNYWRGFWAAVWGATFYRLLLVWIEGVESVIPVFKTSFFIETPFAAQELFAFSIAGAVCGFCGALFMAVKNKYSTFAVNDPIIRAMKRTNFLLYPALIALLVATSTYPEGLGGFVGARLGPAAQVMGLFSNFTWLQPNLTEGQNMVVNNWRGPHTNIFIHLILYIFQQFLCTVLASSLPVPHGCFIPVFRIGAALGRILGEVAHAWRPDGLRYSNRTTQIVPGGYAIVGAAALTAAVTQRVSVAVIALEVTSQTSHALPTLIAVLVAIFVAQYFGPSIYDSGIRAKRLPYLPDLLPHNCAIYEVRVEHFMQHELPCVYPEMPLTHLRRLLNENRHDHFPLVDNPVQKLLLGSVARAELLKLIAQTDKEAQIRFTENPIYHKMNEANEKNANETKRDCNRFDFTQCRTDPAPFQLVAKTSLLKVHSLFSLVGVNSAYVTSMGKLIGMVTLNDLKQAINDVFEDKHSDK